MTLSRQHALTLPANPRAVKLARDWVSKVLTDLGRGDLVSSAELGVSELVTNAIMHSTPPVAVRIRGTVAHPRIEVADRSLVPPRPNEPGEDGDMLLTFGRGLALVALHSAGWGSDLDEDGHGKTVWFEPVDEPRDDIEVEGDLFDLDELIGQRVGDPHEAATVEIRLIGMPVCAFSDLQRHYKELRRELRLLALTNPQRYPLAVEFSETAMDVETERRMTQGLDVLAEAEGNGEQRSDLVYRVPITAPGTMGRLIRLLDQVYDFFDEETLLVARPSKRQLQVQAWYLGEFVRQGTGEEPLPWPGGYQDHRRQNAS